MKKPYLNILAGAGALVIAGCGSIERTNDVADRAVVAIRGQQGQIDAVRNTTSKTGTPTVQYLQKQWVNLRSIEAKDIVPPKALRCRLKVATREPVTLLEFRQLLTKDCKVNVKVTNDALVAVGAISAPTTTGTGAAPLPGAAASPYGSRNEPVERTIDLNYQGELEGLLDLAMGRFGVSYKVDGRDKSEIKIFLVDTETFYLNAIDTTTDLQSVMFSGTTMTNGTNQGGSNGAGNSNGGNSQSGGGSGSSGTNQEMKVSIKNSIWTDVKNAVTSMVTKKENVSTSPATGAVTVTDNADVLARVRSYIEHENKNLTKQVIFNVKVVSVTMSNTDNVGLSWNAVFQTLAGKYGFNLAGGSGPVDGSTTATFSVLKNSGSNWAGSDAIIDALAQQGTVSVKRNPSITALNFRAAGLQVARQDGYVVGSSAVATAQVGTTNTLQTGIITTGFNMSLLPYVMEDNNILLQFGVNLSNLDNLRVVKNGDSAYAELPIINQPINSAQGVKLSPGDTLMLTGFDQEDETSDKRGTGESTNWVFGGGSKGSSKRSSLILLISPVVME
jgi:type IVB pilus formation R64 PilN family outer membrane protein